MNITIPHKFSKATAVAKVTMALVEAQKHPQFAEHVQDLKKSWEGDTLTFSLSLKGNKITGTLEVREHEFLISAKLPLLWRMFEGRIEKAIKEQIAQLGK